ncbi:ChaN family lipoprotein [Azoarcus sp. L1K30]|uniref:ChaN family lipoprotein n=1 Tax=Azoarcus sp. L1K30 TaxID=2820277 RepID=UPI002013010E|nr:ChaN family lipoprotein [Azoarcus sp. L1K30]
MRKSSLRPLLLACATLSGAMAFGLARAADSDTTASCIPPATWAVPEAGGVRATPGPATLAAMALKDVVLLGEQHDDADHHRWQLQTLAALHAQRTRMVIGFEMFPRRLQAVLDQWVAGTLSESRFLELAEWDTVWKLPASLYMPLFEFARLNRISMLALNVDQPLVRATSSGGWAAVPMSMREGVGQPAAPLPAYVDELFDIHRAHLDMRAHRRSGATPDRNDPAFRNFVDAQLLWDRAMAEALASRSRSDAGEGSRPLVVGIMGSGHIQRGHGVPHQLRDLGIRNVGALLPLPSATPCADIPAGLADALFSIPPVVRDTPPPPRLGVGLDTHPEGVRIAEVTPGSLADTAGLRANDVIVEAAGATAPKVQALIATIRSQPAGTWLPMKVKRGSDTIEVVVRFPARS